MTHTAPDFEAERAWAQSEQRFFSMVRVRMSAFVAGFIAGRTAERERHGLPDAHYIGVAIANSFYEMEAGEPPEKDESPSAGDMVLATDVLAALVKWREQQ